MKTLSRVTLILLLNLTLFFSQSQAQNAPSIHDVKGLIPGDTVHFFTAKEADGSFFHLEEALEQGPVVVIFYRGQWCPYCNRHLSNLQDSLGMLMSAGARLIAISPEQPEYLDKMKQKTGAQFTLLYDSAYRISQQFDVLYAPDKKQVKRFGRVAKEDLEKIHGSEHALLPVPATFIIDKNGIIVWRQFDTNQKKRSDVQSILMHLPKD